MLKSKTLLWAGIFIAIVIVIFLAGVGTTYRNQQPPQTEIPHEKTHFHAAFHVYKDSKLEDFSAFKYMHIEICSDEAGNKSSEKSPLALQLEKAHLHDSIGNVVHVHADGALWNDLFQNLKYDLGENLKAYMSDGTELDDPLNREILPYERILFSVGAIENLEEKLTELPDADEIKAVELKSESCGS